MYWPIRDTGRKILIRCSNIDQVNWNCLQTGQSSNDFAYFAGSPPKFSSEFEIAANSNGTFVKLLVNIQVLALVFALLGRSDH